MRIGIDTYSFHRLLGSLRPGETSSDQRIGDGGPAVVRLCVELGADAVAIQTCFLPAVDQVDVAQLREAASGSELIISWGAPDGLAYGLAAGAARDALAWLTIAQLLGSSMMRIVLGGPSLYGLEPLEVRLSRVEPQLAALAIHAADLGLTIAVENHGDINTSDLRQIVEAVNHPALGICFDTANAMRVGDDPISAAAGIGHLVRMIHLKDVEAIENVTDYVAGPRSVAYGAGVVPVRELLTVLRPAIQAGAPVCVEIGQVADGTDEIDFVRKSIDWLRAAAATAS